jgi:hypothetical protein
VSALWRVWRPDCGERYQDATRVEGDSAAAAVERVHDQDLESSEAQTYCVQRVKPSGDGRKVRVVRSLREMAPVYSVSDPLTREQLTGRCPGCRRRWLELDESPKAGTCRFCRRKAAKP